MKDKKVIIDLSNPLESLPEKIEKDNKKQQQLGKLDKILAVKGIKHLSSSTTPYVSSSLKTNVN